MTNPEIQSDTPEQDLSKLRSLRDEIRLQIHLAGMEARAHWEKLEHRIHALERDTRSHARQQSRKIAAALKDVQLFKDGMDSGASR